MLTTFHLNACPCLSFTCFRNIIAPCQAGKTALQLVGGWNAARAEECRAILREAQVLCSLRVGLRDYAVRYISHPDPPPLPRFQVWSPERHRHWLPAARRGVVDVALLLTCRGIRRADPQAPRLALLPAVVQEHVLPLLRGGDYQPLAGLGRGIDGGSSSAAAAAGAAAPAASAASAAEGSLKMWLKRKRNM